MKAIQISEFGGPDVLEHTDVPDPEPGDGHVVVDVARAGINFADTHAIANDYLAEQTLPLIPGGEISGRTPDGRRVAAMIANGGYAEKVAVPEPWLVPVPDEVGDDDAAGLLLQGVTAHALLHHCAHVRDGESVVVEAAAGGTGGLAVQLAKRAGAKVIALASSDEKRAHAERLGADATVDSRADDLKEAITEANGGKVDVVLHMSGTGFEPELGALDALGRIVVFGNAARHPNEVPTNYLLQRSKSVIGFWLVPFIAKRRQELAAAIGELLGAVASGELEVPIGGVYPLSEAARAHRDIAERRTTGKLLLDPSS